MADYEFDYSYHPGATGDYQETGTYDAPLAPWVEQDQFDNLEQFEDEFDDNSDDSSESEEEEQSGSSDDDEEDDDEEDGDEDDEEDGDEDDEEDDDEDYEDVDESDEEGQEAEDEAAARTSDDENSAEDASITNVNINYINYESTSHNNYVHDETYFDNSIDHAAQYYDLSETNLNYAPVSANLDYNPSTTYLAYSPSFRDIHDSPASRTNYSLPSSTPNHTSLAGNTKNTSPVKNAPRSIEPAPTKQKSSFFGLRKPKANLMAPKTNTAYPPANSYHALPVSDTYYTFPQANANNASFSGSINQPRPPVNAKNKPSSALTKDTPKLRGGGNSDFRGKQNSSAKASQSNVRGQSGVASQPNKLAPRGAPAPGTSQRLHYAPSTGIPLKNRKQAAAPPASTMKPTKQVYQAYNPAATALRPNRPAYQAFNPATKSTKPTKPLSAKQTAKGRALPPAPTQVQVGPAAYTNLLETMFRAPVKFDKKGIALYTIGVSNTLKGKAKMKRKGMTCYRTTGQVMFTWKAGKM